MTLSETIRDSPLWDTLRREVRPIVLYGTGNGGDKIVDELLRRGIPLSGVFASDVFVRSRTFRGFHVESLDGITKRLGDDLVILLAFGSSRADVMEQIEKIAERYTLLVPEVPLIGGDVFDRDYFEAHDAELSVLYTSLADEESRALLEDMIRYRLTGRPEYLRRTEPFQTSLRTLIRTENIETVLDGGAFTGDTVRIFGETFPALREVYAVEPDAHSFAKLSAYAADEQRFTVHPQNGILWCKAGTVPFRTAGSRGSGIGAAAKRQKEMEAASFTADELCAGRIDLIKLDVEGAEREALRGAETVIRHDRPVLCVSLYHRTDDLFALPETLRKLCPDYLFSLRRVPCIPAWDLLLYAVPKEKSTLA